MRECGGQAGKKTGLQERRLQERATRAMAITRPQIAGMARSCKASISYLLRRP
jgi:hypothetical protein